MTFSSNCLRACYCAVAILALLAPSRVRAQADTSLNLSRVTVGESRGKDFWVCFPQNARPGDIGASRLFLKLFITGERNTMVRVSVPGVGFNRTYALQANQVIPVDLDSNLQIASSESILKLGVHVEAEEDIAVFGLSNRKASTDTYLALPTNVLGTTYRAIGYHPPQTDQSFATQFNIVATEDNTNVTISLTGDTKGGRRAGETFAVELDQGDVYTVHGGNSPGRRGDLTGSLVVASKPVSFFVGHSCAQVPADVTFCDQLLEMSPPIPSWGRQFYVGRLEYKPTYAIRAVASEDRTKVFLNNQLVAELNAGQYYENNNMKDNAFVTASKPVLLAQYATSADLDPVMKVGDPFMMLITPTEQFLKYYRFATPVRGQNWHHYINLVIPLEGLNSFRLDGNPLAPTYFRTIGLSKFAIAQVELGYGSHYVSCDYPFGLYSYGFGAGVDNYDSYGNDGGQLVQAIPIVTDTVRPMLELVSDNGDLSLGLIARDDRLFDAGLASITIIDSTNWRSPVIVPKFEVGTAQLPLTFRIRDTSECSFLGLRLVDGADNESYWVICRTREGLVWKYTLTEGREILCPSCKGWTAQFITTPSFTVSNVTFDKPQWLEGEGRYDNFRSRLSGSFAGLYLYPFSKEISLAGGIGFSNYSGAVVAEHTSFVRDSILYGDTIGARQNKMIEEFVTDASVNYLNLHAGAYYYFIPEKLFTYFGLASGFLIQSSFVQSAEIIYPSTLEYAVGRSGGVRKKTLASGPIPEPTTFQLALELSPGVQFKLSQKFSLLTGVYLNMPIFDAVQDVNWHLMTFGARLGLQYRH